MWEAFFKNKCFFFSHANRQTSSLTHNEFEQLLLSVIVIGVSEVAFFVISIVDAGHTEVPMTLIRKSHLQPKLENGLEVDENHSHYLLVFTKVATFAWNHCLGSHTDI